MVTKTTVILTKLEIPEKEVAVGFEDVQKLDFSLVCFFFDVFLRHLCPDCLHNYEKGQSILLNMVT